MKAHLNLGRILGVEVGLHYSCFIAALLVVLSLARHSHMTNLGWDVRLVRTSATATGLLLFAALLAHGLSQALVAKGRGLPLSGIVLFALGAVVKTEKRSADPTTEYVIGIAGPITNLLLGLAFLCIAWTVGWSTGNTANTPAIGILVWVGYINLALAFLNMLPGFPLDGGRFLRAIIWRKTGDVDRATRISAGTGRALAFVLVLLGLFLFFADAVLAGLWLVIIGWFLLEAARASFALARMSEMLDGLRVSEAMVHDCPMVDGRLNLEVFVEDVLLCTDHRCFVVGKEDRLFGLITPHEVKKTDRNRWPFLIVADVMRPASELCTVAPDATVAQAFDVMGRENLNQLPVTSNGHLRGMVSRGNILGLLQDRAHLQL